MFQISFKDRCLARKTVPESLWGERWYGLRWWVFDEVFCADWFGLRNGVRLLQFYDSGLFLLCSYLFWSGRKKRYIRFSFFARFSIALERVEIDIPMFHYFIFERRSRTFLPQYWSPCHSSSASSDPSETTLISLVVRCVSSQRVRNLVHVIHNVDVLIHFLIVDQCDIIFLEFWHLDKTVNLCFILFLRSKH